MPLPTASPRPLGLGLSLLATAVPGALMAAGLYLAVPPLVRGGTLSLHSAYLLFFFLPFTLLLVPALALHRLEGSPLTWAAVRDRFWLRRMEVMDWIGALGAFAVFVLSAVLLFPSRRWLLDAAGLAPPDLVPVWADPRVEAPLIWTEFLGVPVGGRYDLALFYFVVLVSNWMGEVLWLRGALLPRQEARFGPWAWVVNGAAAALFYSLFGPWDLAVSLPANLAVSLLVQRRRNATAAFVVYALVNLTAMMPLFEGIFRG